MATRDDTVSFVAAVVSDPKLLKHYQEYELFLKKAKKEFEVKWKKEFKANASYKDFVFLRTLGTGSFGRVLLAKHKDHGDAYLAVKMMDKKHIIRTKQLNHTHCEIRVMDAVQFEFMMFLQYYFTNNCYIFLGMPFISGGEMFGHLRKQGKFDENMTKFYAAQVILAFEYMHYIGMVYRDLKPENILIDKDGYIKIADFGFCKKIDDQRTWTLCGTPEYLAPEMIMSQGYNKSVDWWAIGILIYEMAAGYPPFYSKDPMKLYDKICAGKYSFPSHFSKPLQHLLKNIIVVDKTKRLGSMKDGAAELKSHSWLKIVDWNGILEKKIDPSFKPTITGNEDFSNFEEAEEFKIRVHSSDEFPSDFNIIKVDSGPMRIPDKKCDEPEAKTSCKES